MVTKYMDEIKVVIAGGVHHNTLGVLRSIGDSPIRKENIVLVISGREEASRDFVSKSKYVDRKNVYYLENDKDITEWLLAHKELMKQALICCSDGLAEQVMTHAGELENDYFIPVMSLSTKEMFDKEMQGKLAEEIGFHIPQGKVVTREEQFPLDWNCFPCIVKPLKSTIGAGKADISVAEDREELMKALGNAKADQVQIQQYIDKKMEYQLIGCSLNKGEQIVIPGYTDIIRQPRNTNTGYLKYLPIDTLDIEMRKVHELIRTIGYSGLFSMEFVRDHKGNDYYLETNFRNDGNAYCVKAAGVNLPYLWCYYNMHGNIKDICVNIRKEVYFIPDLEDVKIGIKQVGFLRWWSEFLRAKSHAVFSMRDPYPFVYQVICRFKKRFG